eukprot:gene42800-59158_t
MESTARVGLYEASYLGAPFPTPIPVCDCGHPPCGHSV